MRFSDVIVVVAGVGWLLWAGWWTWKYHFKPMRDRHKIIGAEDDVLLQKIGDNLRTLHDVLGPQFQIRTLGSPGGRSITSSARSALEGEPTRAWIPRREVW